jgi:hypothetical protein
MICRDDILSEVEKELDDLLAPECFLAPVRFLAPLASLRCARHTLKS